MHRLLDVLGGRKAIAAEPLPERPADDDVWQAVCVHLLAEVGRPQLN